MERWWEEASYEQKQTFNRLLKENRIEFVLGGWTMPVCIYTSRVY
jgi:hypothetical protein